jgi:hypothetical protein
MGNFGFYFQMGKHLHLKNNYLNYLEVCARIYLFIVCVL